MASRAENIPSPHLGYSDFDHITKIYPKRKKNVIAMNAEYNISIMERVSFNRAIAGVVVPIEDAADFPFPSHFNPSSGNGTKNYVILSNLVVCHQIAEM